MKRLFFAVFAALVALPYAGNATVFTVSNNADRPAQFTTVQDAVDAASPNDTLLITGGVYSSATLIKPLVLYGESIEGTDFPTTTINSLSLGRFNSSLSSSGSRIYGIRISALYVDPSFSGAGAGQTTLSDLIFERCSFISQLYVYHRDGIDNMTFRNCLFTGAGANLNQQGNNPWLLTNVIMTNCVFSNSYVNGGAGTDANGNLVIRNSLFLNRTTSCFTSTRELILENNIFYKAEPTGLTLSTFNNNLTYLCNANTIPYGDNIGSANIVNQDPDFVNYPALGASHSWDWDYSLNPGSPASGTGTNGTDIGLGGGNAPVSNLPKYAKIPGVTLLEIPVSSVPVGGTLQINIEAESRD